MNHYQFHLSSEIVLDARRAVWLPQHPVLVVADMHLGYAWAQRYHGMLCPITGGDNALERLQELQEEYQPEKIVLLGDIVHRAVPVPELERELKELVENIGNNSRVIFVCGNHDKDLEALLKHCRLAIECVLEFKSGPHLLLHGDGVSAEDAAQHLSLARKSRGKILMGHEHPATCIGDGATTALKCPCFLISDELIVLPAFSGWASGGEARKGEYMSELAKKVTFTATLPILNGRFLPKLKS